MQGETWQHQCTAACPSGFRCLKCTTADDLWRQHGGLLYRVCADHRKVPDSQFRPHRATLGIDRRRLQRYALCRARNGGGDDCHLPGDYRVDPATCLPLVSSPTGEWEDGGHTLLECVREQVAACKSRVGIAVGSEGLRSAGPFEVAERQFVQAALTRELSRDNAEYTELGWRVMRDTEAEVGRVVGDRRATVVLKGSTPLRYMLARLRLGAGAEVLGKLSDVMDKYVTAADFDAAVFLDPTRGPAVYETLRQAALQVSSGVLARWLALVNDGTEFEELRGRALAAVGEVQRQLDGTDSSILLEHARRRSFIKERGKGNEQTDDGDDFSDADEDDEVRGAGGDTWTLRVPVPGKVVLPPCPRQMACRDDDDLDRSRLLEGLCTTFRQDLRVCDTVVLGAGAEERTAVGVSLSSPDTVQLDRPFAVCAAALGDEKSGAAVLSRLVRRRLPLGDFTMTLAKSVEITESEYVHFTLLRLIYPVRMSRDNAAYLAGAATERWTKAELIDLSVTHWDDMYREYFWRHFGPEQRRKWTTRFNGVTVGNFRYLLADFNRMTWLGGLGGARKAEKRVQRARLLIAVGCYVLLPMEAEGLCEAEEGFRRSCLEAFHPQVTRGPRDEHEASGWATTDLVARMAGMLEANWNVRLPEGAGLRLVAVHPSIVRVLELVFASQRSGGFAQQREVFVPFVHGLLAGVLERASLRAQEGAACADTPTAAAATCPVTEAVRRDGAGEALVTLTGCLCERVTGHVLRSETARVDLLQDLLDEIKDILASFARCYHQTREFTGTEEVGKLEELYAMI